jgi:hypothetical protein
VILECLQVGGTRCTSREALARFFDRLTHADGPQPEPSRTTWQRDAATARAERELDKAGI